MAYRLKKSESVPEGLKRIVLEEIDSASQGLAHSENREEAIHEARKSLKKIRGVVRLVQAELGRTYRRENETIGGIGRQLSELRDATAIIEVFDELIEHYKSKLRDHALASIRQGLEKSKEDAEQKGNADQSVQRTLRTFRLLRKRVSSWPLEENSFSALAVGIKDRYRQGRRAMTVARTKQTPESYHEWRKRVKDHWYHIRLFEGAWDESLKAREASLNELETCLGDDHNLTLLCEKIQQNPGLFGAPADTDLFLALSLQRQRELRDRAGLLGDQLYQKKPGSFTRSMERSWEKWRVRPEKPSKKTAKRQQLNGRKSVAA